MAKLYRGKSLLRKKRDQYFIFSGISILISILSIVAFVQYNAIIFGPIIFLASVIISRVLFIKGKITSAGVKGEKISLKISKKLPNDYLVFNNLFIDYDGRKSELDLVVVGSNGIFIIEVKNHNGIITGDKDDYDWVQHKTGQKGGQYKSTMGNPIKQVKRQTYLLSKEFKSEGLNVWIQGVVFFSNKLVKLDINDNLVPVFSINDNELINYIKTYKSNNTYDKKYIERIKKFLIRRQK